MNVLQKLNENSIVEAMMHLGYDVSLSKDKMGVMFTPKDSKEHFITYDTGFQSFHINGNGGYNPSSTVKMKTDTWPTLTEWFIMMVLGKCMTFRQMLRAVDDKIACADCADREQWNYLCGRAELEAA